MPSIAIICAGTTAYSLIVNDLLADGGLERHELSVDEVMAREPTLRGDIIGGFWTESDSTGGIHKFTSGLADWLEKQGVTFKLGVPSLICIWGKMASTSNAAMKSVMMGSSFLLGLPAARSPKC